jgi:hypothetical protein
MKVISHLDKTIGDKKKALLVKMNHDGLRLPAILNKACIYQPTHYYQRQEGLKLLQENIPPEEL